MKRSQHVRVSPPPLRLSPPLVMPRRLTSPGGKALILVPLFRDELGAPCPKFSGLKAVPTYQRENRYLHTIILIYKLRKLNMLFNKSLPDKDVSGIPSSHI